jgi:uncharacterized Zn finger protein
MPYTDYLNNVYKIFIANTSIPTDLIKIIVYKYLINGSRCYHCGTIHLDDIISQEKYYVSVICTKCKNSYLVDVRYVYIGKI